MKNVKSFVWWFVFLAVFSNFNLIREVNDFFPDSVLLTLLTIPVSAIISSRVLRMAKAENNPWVYRSDI